MGLLAVIALVVLGWAWFTGRLVGWTARDAIALAAVIFGARLAASGAAVAGLVLIGGGAWWFVRNRPWLGKGKASGGDDRALAEARELLGILPDADARIIRAAYRDRIAKSHPDTGGSTAEATRLAEARDLLLAELAAKRRMKSR